MTYYVRPTATSNSTILEDDAAGIYSEIWVVFRLSSLKSSFILSGGPIKRRNYPTMEHTRRMDV